MSQAAAALLAALALALGIAACGDEPPPNHDRRTVDGTDTAPNGGPDRAARPARLGDRFAPTRANPKAGSEVKRLGRPLPTPQARQAVAVAVGYYDARAARDWKRACALMSLSLKRQFAGPVERPSNRGGGDCPAAMRTFAARVPPKALAREAREIRFNQVRANNHRAHAIFKSKTIPNGTIPMTRENSQWKVAALVGTPL